MFLTLTEIDEMAEKVGLKLRYNTDIGLIERAEKESDSYHTTTTDSVVRVVLARLHEQSQNDKKEDGGVQKED